MLDCAVLVSTAVAGAAGQAMGEAIDNKTMLGWCFTAAALNFSVFGFVYGIYANAALMEKDYLRVISLLKWFCTIIALVIVVLTLLAAFLAHDIQARTPVYLIVACFAVLAGLSLILAIKMWTPPNPPAP